MKAGQAALLLGTLLFSAAGALAIEPPGELGKVTRRHERRIIGREDRDNTFRKPGGILEGARTARPQVDVGELAVRQRALYRGGSFTQGLPALAPGARDAAAAEARPPQPPTATTAGPLSAARYAILAGAVGLLLLLAAWLVRRRIAQPATARRRLRSRSSARPGGGLRRGRSAWLDRDLSITMGQHEGDGD